MIHTEYLDSANEQVEIVTDGKDCLWAYIKDSEAILFESFQNLVKYVYLGEEVDRLYFKVEELSRIYEISYSYHIIKQHYNNK